MPVETLFISGPEASGKSSVARLVATEVLSRPVHYLRVRRSSDGYSNAVIADPSLDPEHIWASSHLVTYTPERAFETVPDALRQVRRIERTAFACLEADGESSLRHAYPYDFRLFVMAAPLSLREIFRDPQDAASALQQVMQDTAAFASEIFGLFDAVGIDDSAGVEHCMPPTSPREEAVERLDIGEAQLKQFLSSPLGAEIASRIQLQPDYHGLVESDITIINTGVRGTPKILDETTRRIEKLLSRVRQDARRHSVLYWGDIMQTRDRTRDKLLKRLQALFAL